MEIRLAKESDLKERLKLYRTLFDYMNELEPYFFREAEQDAEFVKSIIIDENSDVVLAIEGNEILGFALMQVQNNPPYNSFENRKFAYLMDLVTKEGQREKGVGTRLLEEFEIWGKEKEVDHLELSVLNKNTNAHSLYLKKGFNEKMVNMYKFID